MKLYSQENEYKLYQGDMLDMLSVIEPNSISSIVTDPPYELNFMGKGWDNSGIAFRKETWEKCLTVLKPGGYLLAFGGTRTFHRIACAIEDAGFEIRDTIMWLYGSGFPKSMDIGKAIEAKLTIGSANKTEFKNLDGEKVTAGGWGISAMSADQGFRPTNYDLDGHLRTVEVEYTTEQGKQWDGWGTALKPAYEPVIVARKPCDGSATDNVLKYGVGGLNIDECRIGTDELKPYTAGLGGGLYNDDGWCAKPQLKDAPSGRFPSNLILTYDKTDYKEVCGDMPYTESNGGASTMPNFKDAGQKNSYNKIGFNDGQTAERKQSSYIAPMDSGNASRYFYCAKASNKDRDEGLNEFDATRKCGYGYDRGYGNLGDGMFKDRNTQKKNTHPTVKPIDLMQYLVRLVTPNGGTVLDPFNGSGSTGKAVMYENRERNKGYKYIGIELTEQYLPISKARIEYALHVDNIEIVDKESGKVENFKQSKLF